MVKIFFVLRNEKKKKKEKKSKKSEEKKKIISKEKRIACFSFLFQSVLFIFFLICFYFNSDLIPSIVITPRYIQSTCQQL